jgi:hypothetical protein
MVEVRARDSELVGHLALVEPALAPKSLEPRAEEELALKHHVKLSNILQRYKSEHDMSALFDAALLLAMSFPATPDKGASDE